MGRLSPWELVRRDIGAGWAEKAKKLVDEKGTEAYDIGKQPPMLTMAIEDELTQRQLRRDPMSFGQFFRHSDVRQVYEDKYWPLLVRKDAQTGGFAYRTNFLVGLQQAWHHGWHVLSGEKVYEVTPELARMLKNTSLKGVMAEDLRLPFKNICVLVPEEIVDLRVTSDREHHLVRAFYITEDVPDPEIGVSMIGRGQSVPMTYDEKFEGRTWRILTFSGAVGEDPKKERIQQFHVPLPNGDDLDGILAKMLKASGGDEVFRWAMNVVLYMTWPECDAEHVMANEEARKLWDRIKKLSPNSKKREDLKDRARKLGPQWRTILGRHLPEYLKNPENEGTGLAVTVRTKVGFHWQRYWYGPRNQPEQRTRKWRLAKGYWRGPEDGQVSNPRHILV